MAKEAPPPSDPAAPALAAYRRAVARLGGAEDGAARAELEDLGAGESPQAPKARMRLAQLEMDAGDYAAAEARYQAETAALLSDGRKAEVAAVYFELAAAAARPEAGRLDGGGGDPGKALRLLGYLLDLELPEAVTARALLEMGRVGLAGGLYGEAGEAFTRFLALFDPRYQEEVEGRAPGEGRLAAPQVGCVEARLGAIEAALRDADAFPDPASDDLEDPADAVPDRVLALVDSTRRLLEAGHPEASPGDLERARFFTPLAEGLGGAFDPDGGAPAGPAAARAAVRAAEAYWRHHPGTAAGVELMRLAPRALYSAGLVDEAAALTRRLLDAPAPTDPAGARRFEASKDLGLFALGAMAAGDGRPGDAVAAFQGYLQARPDGAMWQAAQAGIERGLAAEGLARLGAGDAPACRARWEEVLQRRGLAESAGWLALAIALTHGTEARKAAEAGTPRVAAGHRDRALAELEAVARRYPGEVAGRAREARGKLALRGPSPDLEAAVKDLRAADTPGAHAALRELEETELELTAARVYGAAEVAVVGLRTRNLEKVTLKRYPINLEDYFRKYHEADGIERLDLDLVSPAETWEVAVEGYRRYLRRDTELPIRNPGPGAYAIRVEADRFEATVLVLVSDLDLAFTTTPEEVVALVTDRAAGAPRAGVELIAWGGEAGAQSLALKTGDDGVARGRWTAAPDRPPRGFARRGDHVAVCGMRLPDLAIRRLKPRGYLETSRPVYLPGETVRLRAVIREVKDGRYDPGAGAAYTVELAGPDGAVLARRDARLDAYGALRTRVALPPAAALGAWQLRVAPRARPGAPRPPVYTRRFEVARVRLARVELTLEPGAPAVRAGDPLPLTLKAAYYTGAPLPARAIELTLPDGRVTRLTTDAAGVAETTVDTTPFFRRDALALRARLPGEEAEAALRVPLLPAARVLTPADRPASPARGQRLALGWTLTTPGGDPVAGEVVRVEVLRPRPAADPGLPADVLRRADVPHAPPPEAARAGAETLEAVTDDAGRARVEVDLDAAGRWRYRAAAADPAGREVFETGAFEVRAPASPELELVAETTRLRVGDDAAVTVGYRDAPRAGLLLFLGAGVLRYQVHDFAPGRVPLALPVAPGDLPNFRLEAVVSGTSGLHRAAQDFEVRRALTVEVGLPEGPLAPGAPVELTVTTRDEHGRPAPATVSLGLVDRALLAKFPDPLPPIREHFEAGARRHVALAAGSSAAFRQTGARREVAAAVLEELARAAQARRDKEARLEQQELVAGASLFADNIADLDDAFGLEVEEACPEPPQMMLGRVMAARSMAPPPPPGAPAPKRRARRGRDQAKKPAGPPAARRELPLDGAWLGAVETGPDGRAAVTLDAPRRTGRYRVLARGAGAGDLFGEWSGDAVVRRDAWVELTVPDFLVHGDAVRPVVTVHTADPEGGDFRLEFEAGGAGARAADAADVRAAAAAPGRLVLDPIEVTKGTALRLAVTLSRAGRVLDRLVKTVPLRPWGVPEVTAFSGVLEGDATVPVGAGGPGPRRLVIDLFPPDAAPPPSPGLPDFPGIGLGARALKTAAALRRVAARAGRDDAETATLRARAADRLAALLASQRPDGSFPWLAGVAPDRADGDAGATGWALFGLDEAAAAGLAPSDAAASRARDYLAAAGLAFDDDGELPALIALARRGEADFSVLNRLHRQRAGASRPRAAALGWALALAERPGLAADLAAQLGAPAPGDDAPTLAAGALLTRALATPEAAAWDAAARARAGGAGLGAAWAGYAAAATPPAATGPADATVTVSVGGVALGEYRLGPDATPGRFVFEDAPPDGAARPVRLAYSGRGRVAYRIRGERFDVAPEPIEDLAGLGLYPERQVMSPRLYRGRRLVPSEMPAAAVAFSDYVERVVTARAVTRGGGPPGPYLALTVWLPAGARLDPTSLPPQALRVVEDRGRLTMLFAGRPPPLRLRLLPTCPGTYRCLPAALRAAADPGATARPEAAGPALEVRAPGEDPEVAYRWRDDERRAFGLAADADGDDEAALAHLRALPAARRDEDREVLKALLGLYTRRPAPDPGELVDLFEVLERRFPDETLGYATLRAVGRAYAGMGEAEAACHLWRATLTAAFRDEVPAAAELEGAGEYLRGVAHLEALFWRYPDLPIVTETYYGLAQDIYAHKDDAAALGDARGAAAVGRAVALLEEFLRLFADLPYAEEATFSLLGAYRELGAHAACRGAAAAAADRFPEGEYRLRFRYMEALAAFDLGEYADAVEAAEAVARSGARDGDTAALLLGQMYQALARAPEALAAYRRVRDRFPDAARSIEYLERRRVRLPEVVRAAPGEEVEVEVEYVGATEVEVLAYQVDLMRLFLKERSLDRVTGVALAGITPTCTFTRALPPRPAGTTGRAQISLPFEAKGAYLVLARAGEVFASGLALVTDLALELDAGPEGVRVAVHQGPDAAPARDVFVRLSDGGRFEAGTTDLRGVVSLPLRGAVTAVARRGEDEYAFEKAAADPAGPPVEVFAAAAPVAYDADIRADNIAVQSNASAALRRKFHRRSKKERGVKAAQVR